MQTKTAMSIPSRRRRRTRAAPAARLLGALATEEQAARALAWDLAALVRAGLITAFEDGAELRFAVDEPGDEAA